MGVFVQRQRGTDASVQICSRKLLNTLGFESQLCSHQLRESKRLNLLGPQFLSSENGCNQLTARG